MNASLFHRLIGAALTIVLFSGCGGGRATVPPTPENALSSLSPARSEIDWPTFGFDTARTGYNARETQLTTSTVHNLVAKWSFKLGNDFSNTEPIVASHVSVSGGKYADIVYVGDEIGDFYAINAASGKAIWSKALGHTSTPQCGLGSDGVTSTPVLDRTKNRIYVLDGLGKIWAFDLGTGARSAGFAPKTLYGDPTEYHTWSGLLLSADGSKIYYPTASHCDEGTYFGTIDAIDTSSEAITTFNLVTNKKTYYGNGVWSWGGESIDPDTGNLYAGVGNSLGSLGETGQYSDSIIELTAPSLQFVADEQPETNLQSDLDIGTTPVLYDDQGSCAAFERKDGNFFTIDRRHLVNENYATKLNLGGQLATPAYSPAAHALYASVPNGLTKLSVGANCTVSTAWQTAIGANGESPPVVADGVVYASGGSKLYALDATSGGILWNSAATISGSIIPAPTVVNGHVYASSRDGHLYAFGL
ncbi:MAG: PQQ-binding-like beta-propeller repeat protein [Candidatus Eremiobacteraeota bacterium]|nr:PQQ-binding-like beta-propeller repeat protein [Candidatus Eremiobacteraeota bacterium]